MCDNSQDKYLQIWISGSDQALVTLQCTVTVSYRVSSVNLNPFRCVRYYSRQDGLSFINCVCCMQLTKALRQSII